MIPPDSILASLAQRRCVVSQRALTSEEVLLSRQAVPAFYDREADARADSLLNLTIQATLDLAKQAGFSEPAVRDVIRVFWARILDRASLDSVKRERVLHLYLFYFSDYVVYSDGDEILQYEEVYIPQESPTWNRDSSFCSRLVTRVARDAPVDMLARDGTRVLMIEVKYEGVDDRALGQMMRYFECIRYLMNSVDHLCDLRTLIPVLVVQKFPPSHWISLPTSFRELVRVYFYRVESDVLVLRDGRRGLQVLLRGDARHRF